MISICLNFNHVTSKMNAVFFTVIVYFSITCSPKPTPTTGALYTKHVLLGMIYKVIHSDCVDVYIVKTAADTLNGTFLRIG